MTTTTGDKLFIEYKSGTAGAVYTEEAAATQGTTYAAKVTYNGANSFTAQIGSYSLTITLNNNGYPWQGVKAVMESQQRPVGGLCNTANTQFTNVSPSLVGGSNYTVLTDTSQVTFALIYYTPTQSFAAYSPWVPDGCGSGGPCLRTG